MPPEVVAEATSLSDVVRELQRLRRAVESGSAELLDSRSAARLFGVSRPTWFRLVASGRVPAGLRIGAGCVRWRRAELVRLIETWK